MIDYPEEYTDGYVMFMGRRFTTDPRALIPRLETEELVNYCMRLLSEHPHIQTVADIGTGSGIIPISLLSKADRPLTVFATDMSQEALELAQENAQKNSDKAPLSRGVARSAGGFNEFENPPIDKRGTKGEFVWNISRINPPPSHSSGTSFKKEVTGGITFLHWDLLEPLIRHFWNSVPEALLITANLPYVREKEINSWLIHEPRMAFLGGVQTGFELYERFFEQLLAWNNRPRQCYVVIEFWLWQRDIAETVFQKHGFEYTFFPDLRGIERFACVVV